MINGMRYVAASILLVCAVMVHTPALADRAQSAAPKLEQLSDTPHTGEDALATFQFVKGRLDEKPSVLLLRPSAIPESIRSHRPPRQSSTSTA